jgi:hypothetical protein
MEIRLNNHPELFDWNITYPIPIENQNNELGFFTLQK